MCTGCCDSGWCDVKQLHHNLPLFFTLFYWKPDVWCFQAGKIDSPLKVLEIKCTKIAIIRLNMLQNSRNLLLFEVWKPYACKRESKLQKSLWLEPDWRQWTTQGCRAALNTRKKTTKKLNFDVRGQLCWPWSDIHIFMDWFTSVASVIDKNMRFISGRKGSRGQSVVLIKTGHILSALKKEEISWLQIKLNLNPLLAKKAMQASALFFPTTSSNKSYV